MRRRILTAILATVALSLTFAGTGTYLLLRRQADRSTEAGLRDQAEGVIGLLPLARAPGAGAFQAKRVIKGLQLQGISIVAIGPSGRIRGELPEGIEAADIEPAELLDGTTVSGRRDGLVFAAASTTIDAGRRPPNDRPDPGSVAPRRAFDTVAVVLTRAPQQPGAPIGWFLVAGAAALVIGAAVAAGVSAGLARPLREAKDATVRIAGGDLGGRLPEPPAGATDEVAALTRSINTMAARLGRSREQERRFLLSVSHDLRTPLTSIRGYADAIIEHVGPTPAEAARVIGVEAQRLERLVRDLLDLARLDAREFGFDLRPVSVAEVVVDAAEGLRSATEAAGLHLTVTEPTADTTALVDPDRLAQVVANLGENAVKFAATGVWIDVTVEGTEVVVQMTDDGPGIAADDLTRVFERLYVTDRRPVRPAGGTGLGLAIVAELVEGMGGQVTIDSPALADGRGARFTVRLPTDRSGA